MASLVDETDPPQDLRAELAAEGQPLPPDRPGRLDWWLSGLSALTLVFVASVAWLYYAPLLVFNTVRFLLTRKQRLLGASVQDALRLETIAALVTIPIAGTLATVGTSWAFYVWSRGEPGAPAAAFCATSYGCRTNREAGWTILVTTIVLTFELILVSLREIRGHVGGRRVRPYQPDVDSAAGIRELMKEYQQGHRAVLPYLRPQAASLALKAVPRLTYTDPVRPLTGRAALGVIFQRRHLARLSIVVAAGTAFAIVAVYRDAGVALILLCLSGITFCISTFLDVELQYLDRIRALRRIYELQENLRRRRERDAEERRRNLALKELTIQLERVAVMLSELRVGTDGPPERQGRDGDGRGLYRRLRRFCAVL